MRARLLFHKKQRYKGGIVEMISWQLPGADAERPHGLKYRLYFGRKGERLVGYDNERGKGDHKHIGAQEYPYAFQGVAQLIRDFLRDVEHYGGQGDG